MEHSRKFRLQAIAHGLGYPKANQERINTLIKDFELMEQELGLLKKQKERLAVPGNVYGMAYLYADNTISQCLVTLKGRQKHSLDYLLNLVGSQKQSVIIYIPSGIITHRWDSETKSWRQSYEGK